MESLKPNRTSLYPRISILDMELFNLGYPTIMRTTPPLPHCGSLDAVVAAAGDLSIFVFMFRCQVDEVLVSCSAAHYGILASQLRYLQS